MSALSILAVATGAADDEAAIESCLSRARKPGQRSRSPLPAREKVTRQPDRRLNVPYLGLSPPSTNENYRHVTDPLPCSLQSSAPSYAPPSRRRRRCA